MKILAKALVEAASILDHVPQRTGIQSSEFIRFVCKKGVLEMALASDLIGVAKVPVEEAEDFTFFVERKLFMPFVMAAKGKDKPLSLALADEGKTLTLKDGRRTGKWAALDVMKGYSSADGQKETKLEIKEALIGDLRLAAKYASLDQLAPELSCVWLDATAGRIYSTNKFSVFMGQVKSIKEGGPIPAAFPDLLDAGAEIRVGLGGARISYPSAYLYQAFNSKSLEAFPKDAIVKTMKAAKAWKARVTLPTKKLLEILSRLAGYVSGASSDETIIRVEAKAGDPFLRLKTGSSAGAFTEALKIMTGPEEDWSADWLLVSIKPFLEAAGDSPVSASWDDTTPYCFQDEANKRWLISPRKAGK